MGHIIAMGGGGFSMEPDNLALDHFILQQASKSKPEVCFLPTASADADSYCQRFYDAFSRLRCRTSHLSLFRPPTADLETFLLAKDVIYVSGGNTKCMLALWREWGLDAILRKAWEKGIVLAGLSAGAICWFEQGVTDSIPGPLTPLTCLGFLSGSYCPHYDGEVERRPSYRRLILQDAIQAGYGVDDGAALHYVGSELTEVVSSRPKATAYLVRKEGDQIQEVALPNRYLLK